MGLHGAGLQHLAPIPSGFRTRLTLERGEIVLPCTVTRCEAHPSPAGINYHTGVQFDSLEPRYDRALREFMVAEISKAIDEWKKNARGELPTVLENLPLFDTQERLVHVPRAKRGREIQSYTWHRLIGGKWIESFVLDPSQPVDGFALPAEQAPDETALLRKAYDISDENGRRLIRLMAQLAIAGIED